MQYPELTEGVQGSRSRHRDAGCDRSGKGGRGCDIQLRTTRAVNVRRRQCLLRRVDHRCRTRAGYCGVGDCRVAVVVSDIRPKAGGLCFAILHRDRERSVSETSVRSGTANENGRGADAEEGTAGRIWTNDHTALASESYRRGVVHDRAASARRDSDAGWRRDGAALRVAHGLICRDGNRPACHRADVSTGIVHHVQTPGAV